MPKPADVLGWEFKFRVGAEAALDTAATVLRLLYLRDLRTLQTQIDEALVRVQARTPHNHCCTRSACACGARSCCKSLCAGLVPHAVCTCD